MIIGDTVVIDGRFLVHLASMSEGEVNYEQCN